MNRLLSVTNAQDILPIYRDTPVGRLLEYHNLSRPHDSYLKAELLIGMCMDNRKHLHIPDNFAFIIRAGGANLRYSEFKVSYAIAVGEVSAIALIGHTQCAMVNLIARKEQFVRGLVERAGWKPEAAEKHFHRFAPTFEIGNEIDFILSEAKRLRVRYPKILVAPMFYRVEDNLLYLLDETNLLAEKPRPKRKEGVVKKPMVKTASAKEAKKAIKPLAKKPAAKPQSKKSGRKGKPKKK